MYEDDLRKTEEQLGQISPSMCLAKWYQVTLHLHNGETHSCHHPRTHKIPLEEIAKDPSALHNTSYKKEQRRLMVEGTRPSECQYCWNIEDSGGISDRVTKSNDEYCKPYMGEVIATDKQQLWQQNVNPSYLEVSFDYTCNLKCAYCYPHISSSWHQEIKQHGGYPTQTSKNDLKYFEDKLPYLKREHNPYVEAFWKWWPDVSKDLDTLRVTGGEPLLSKDWWKLLDAIIENPQPHINLGVNSNLVQDPALIQKLIDKVNQLEGKVKSFTIFHSVDTGIAAHAEYIRYGLDYQLYQRNLESLLEGIKWRVNFSTMCTVTNLSTIGFKDLYRYMFLLRSEYCDRHYIQVDTPYLRNPQYMEVRIGNDITVPYLEDTKKYVDTLVAEYRFADYPEEIKRGYARLHDKFPYFIQKNSLRIDRIINFAKTDFDPSKAKVVMKDFYRFYNEYDRRRNTNFCKTFPEFEEFYHRCKEL
jgi:hypothetical protein